MNTNRLASAPAILALGTAVPQFRLQQAAIGEWMATAFTDQPRIARLIRAAHAQSGIETRYSCIPDYGQATCNSRYTLGGDLQDSATTAERMALYTRESVPLALAAAQSAIAELANERQISPLDLAAQITHLIAVSCTGFFAPGLDFALTKQLQLDPTVDRQLIGFMGCAAAFNGLRSAFKAVRSEPGALALVVCVELASLHTYPNHSRDTIIAASLFADGAGAALVGQPIADDRHYFTLEQFHTTIKPDTEEEMAWQIGNHGFTLRLSPRVPNHLAEVAPAALNSLFAQGAPDFWAIHPGGRAIVEALATIFSLSPRQTRATLAILRDYGNMSSATILFVLQELKRRRQAEAMHLATDARPCQGVAMAFGPGLVIEMVRLRYVEKAPPEQNGRVNGLLAREGETLWR